MSNQTFKNAKDAKYDEYYTQYYDIEREIEACKNTMNKNIQATFAGSR